MERYDSSTVIFAASFSGNAAEARNAVAAYQQLALEHGFAMAGKYPSKDHLYKMVQGVCYHIDFEHCFDGDSDQPVLQFTIGEPYGGFDYVKPEPKKNISLKDLFR